ncbi:glycosyltransferase [Paenibacillus filicis]|uniref:Glucosyl-3-phosphoglycerate synthase n=1 Tax=Paenibacillus filicis TaxID=669464 RepID=A0ABU9DT62_9BACL
MELKQQTVWRPDKWPVFRGKRGFGIKAKDEPESAALMGRKRDVRIASVPVRRAPVRTGKVAGESNFRKEAAVPGRKRRNAQIASVPVSQAPIRTGKVAGAGSGSRKEAAVPRRKRSEAQIASAPVSRAPTRSGKMAGAGSGSRKEAAVPRRKREAQIASAPVSRAPARTGKVAGAGGGSHKEAASPERSRTAVASISRVLPAAGPIARPSARPAAVRARSKSPVRRGLRTAAPKRGLASLRSKPAFRDGYRMGREDGTAGVPEDGDGKLHSALNRCLARRLRSLQETGSKLSGSRAMSQGYLRGYFSARQEPVPDWVLMPVEQSVAVVVTAMNEQATISRTLRQAARLGVDELIVIVNGSTDRTLPLARKQPEAQVVHYPHPLGHDVGRAVGARLTKSDIVLFLDGDIPIPAERLVAFVRAVSRGMDIALNDIGPYLGTFGRRDQVTHMKQFLNVSLGRRDLQANSLTAVPHAMSRQAVERLGPELLMVPPKAQAAAILQGMRIGVSASVNVIRRNKRRRSNQGNLNRVAKLIIGDHLEAIKLAVDQAGARLRFPDKQRKRLQREEGNAHGDAEHHYSQL